jgi:hypothetical protein
MKKEAVTVLKVKKILEQLFGRGSPHPCEIKIMEEAS